MTKRRRSVIGWAVLGAVVVAVVLVAGAGPPSYPRFSPASPGPGGTKAFVELLGRLGDPVDVEVGSFPSTPASEPASERGRVAVEVGSPPSTPPHGTVLVFSDSRGEEAGPLASPQREQVGRWVQGGGKLVLADPRSPLASLAEAYPSRVTLVADAADFTNARLAQDGNASRDVRVVGAHPGWPVDIVFPPAVTGTGSRSLLSIFDRRTKTVLVGLLVAALIWLVSRSRRFGDPLSEAPTVAVDSSATVEAMGRLLMRSERRG